MVQVRRPPLVPGRPADDPRANRLLAGLAPDDYAGLVTVVGFLIAFSLSQLGGRDRTPSPTAATGSPPAAVGRTAR